MTDPAMESYRLGYGAGEPGSGPGTGPQGGPGKGSGIAAVVALIAGVGLVLAIAGAGVYFLSEWVGEQTASGSSGGASSEASPPKVPLISAVGFSQLRDDLEKETGSTEVVDLTVYPLYAVAQVLVDPDKGRTRSLYYDGAFSQSSLGTTTDEAYDVSQVDADAIAALSRKARRMVEDPNQWYLIVRAPDADGAVMWAYASNEYGEGGYVSAKPDGKVVSRVTW